MIRQSGLVISATMFLLLAACSSSPRVNYYSLDDTAATPQAKPADVPVVGFGPMRFPEYLKGKRMITRGSNSKVTVHEFDRWTESVEESMHRIIAGKLDNQLKNAIVVAYPYMHAVNEVDYRLKGSVERFDADASGKVVLSVQWNLSDTDDKLILPPRRELYQASIGEGAATTAIVQAMNQLMSEFSEDIASAIDTALQ